MVTFLFLKVFIRIELIRMLEKTFFLETCSFLLTVFCFSKLFCVGLNLAANLKFERIRKK